MGSRLAEIVTAFDNVYSGWILWNLFLAFVPLLLSFWLFRPRALPRYGFRVACGLVGAIGIIGLWSRSPKILRSWADTLGDAVTGDPGALLRLSWLGLVLAVALGLWRWGLNPHHTRQPWLWWLGVVVFMAFLPNAPYVLTDIIHLIRGTRLGGIPTWVIALVFVPIHVTAIVLGFEAYVIAILNLAYYLKQQGAKAWILPMELTIHALSAIGIYLGRFIRFNSWDLVTDPLDVLADTLNVLTSKRPLAVVIVTFMVLTVLYWLMKQITLGLKLRIHYARQGIDALG
ncbi:MAG: hypothetical protein RLZZ597_1875 [Cyanobacteriota bacterium]|jgi:uncharacterized membrane protein